MNWIQKNLAYTRYLFLHKKYVFQAGLLTKAPLWRLIIHDWSKLTPLEWTAYREFFYGTRTPEVKAKFERAWLAHIHRNKHHWDHWITKDRKTFKPVIMPDKYIREMVADWAGAGRAINGRWELAEWYGKNSSDMTLHSHTRSVVDGYVSDLAKKLEKR